MSSRQVATAEAPRKGSRAKRPTPELVRDETLKLCDNGQGDDVAVRPPRTLSPAKHGTCLGVPPADRSLALSSSHEEACRSSAKSDTAHA